MAAFAVDEATYLNAGRWICEADGGGTMVQNATNEFEIGGAAAPDAVIA
jgi:hypothetical protein